MATTEKPKAPRKTPQRRLSSPDEIAEKVFPAIYASAAEWMFNQPNGNLAKRAAYLSYEAADAFVAYRESRA